MNIPLVCLLPSLYYPYFQIRGFVYEVTPDKSIIFPYSQEGEFLFSLWKRDNAGYITLTSIDVSDFFQDTEFLGYVRGDDIVDVFDKIMNTGLI